MWKHYWKAWNIIVIWHNGWNCFVLGAIEAISQQGRRLCFLNLKNVIIHQFCKFLGFMNLLCAYLFFFSGMLLVRNPAHPCFKGPCMISAYLLLLFFKILPRFAFNIPNISSFLCNLLSKATTECIYFHKIPYMHITYFSCLKLFCLSNLIFLLLFFVAFFFDV